jgi:hypothetical protein
LFPGRGFSLKLGIDRLGGRALGIGAPGQYGEAEQQMSHKYATDYPHEILIVIVLKDGD